MTTLPHLLARVRDVPSRARALALTLGGILGLPALFVFVAGRLFAADLAIGGIVCIIIAFVAFVVGTIVACVLIFQAKSRLGRAEHALYSGDYETATREAQFVLRTVFRADYQMGALFTLALTAERLAAFGEAGALFVRALEMVPMMAAARPARRVRALLAAHAALDLAAANDLPRAAAMLVRCWAALGAPGQPGGLEPLLDDSYMGAIGINTMLVELENRRDPRPLAVLATALLAWKHRQPHEALRILGMEQVSLGSGLAAYEKELADRIHAASLQQLTQAGPHRSAGMVGPAPMSGWAALVLSS